MFSLHCKQIKIIFSTYAKTFGAAISGLPNWNGAFEGFIKMKKIISVTFEQMKKFKFLWAYLLMSEIELRCSSWSESESTFFLLVSSKCNGITCYITTCSKLKHSSRWLRCKSLLLNLWKFEQKNKFYVIFNEFNWIIVIRNLLQCSVLAFVQSNQNLVLRYCQEN